jgi:cyclohexadienyl dehydratase
LLAALLLAGCVTDRGATPAVGPTAAPPAAGPTATTQPDDATHFASPQAAQDLAQAVADRLDLMRDVAAAKWISGAPIQDPVREAAVLKRVAERARMFGLDADATQLFFDTQIRIARDIQQQWHARWRAAGHCAPCDQPAPLQAVRERIDAANEQQLAALYVAAPLRADEAADLQRELWARLLSREVTAADIDQLHLAAVAITRVSGGSVLERVQATRVLRIATTGDYAPFSLEAGGRLTGADIELAIELAANLGARPVFIRTSWPGLLEDLRADRFDVALSGIGFTPERAALGLFSVAYQDGGKTLLARCEDRDRFDSPAELDRAGNRVIVNPGGTNERYVREHVRQAQVIVHPDNRGVFAEIAARRADVMVTDDVEAELQARRWPGRLCRTYAGTLTRGDKRILMARDPALQAAVDTWLRQGIAAGAPARALERAMQQYVDGAAAP